MPRIDSLSTTTDALGTLATALRLLADQGLNDVAIQWPIDDRDFRERLAYFWATRGYQESDSQRAMRLHVGEDNFFGIPDAIRFFPDDAEMFPEVQWKPDTLKRPAEGEGKLLVAAVPQVSALQVRKMYPRFFLWDSEYNKNDWLQREGRFAWHEILLDADGRFVQPPPPHVALYLGVAHCLRQYGPWPCGLMQGGYKLEWTPQSRHGRKMFLTKE